MDKFFYNKKVAWGRSSPGRALEWHSRGKEFDPPRLHHDKNRYYAGILLVSSGFFGSMSMVGVKAKERKKRLERMV